MTRNRPIDRSHKPNPKRVGCLNALNKHRPRLRATVVAGEDPGNPVIFTSCTSICAQPEDSFETKTGLLRHPSRRKIARKGVLFNAIETQAGWPLIEGEVQNRVYRLGQDPLASVLRRHPVSDRGLTGVYVVESDDTGELIVESDGPRTGCAPGPTVVRILGDIVTRVLATIRNGDRHTTLKL